MELTLNDYISDELKDYLLMQNGIIDVVITRINDKYLTKLNIKYNNKTTPEIIMKYIELFQNNKYSILFDFDKGTIGNYKKLQYTIGDMCCNYCYEGLVMDLFENSKIKSVKSNFEFKMPALNIEFIIEYSEDFSEQELIEYINEKYK